MNLVTGIPETPQPYSFDQVNEKMTSFMDKTRELAHGILDSEQLENPSSLPMNHYHAWYWPWHPVHYFCEPITHFSSSTQGIKEKSQLAILAGALSIVYATVRVAQSIGTLFAADTELSEIRDVKKLIQRIEYSPEVVIHSQGKLNKIIEIEERIFGRVQVDAKVDLSLKGLLALGSIFLIRGGWIRCSRTIDMGIFATATAALGIFFKWGLGYTESENQKDAQKLLGKLNDLQKEHSDGIVQRFVLPVGPEVKEEPRVEAAETDQVEVEPEVQLVPLESIEEPIQLAPHYETKFEESVGESDKGSQKSVSNTQSKGSKISSPARLEEGLVELLD